MVKSDFNHILVRINEIYVHLKSCLCPCPKPFRKSINSNCRKLSSEAAIGRPAKDYQAPQLHKCDRIFWVFLSRTRQDWKSALIIVKPETVIKWHGLGFKLYRRWKSRTNKVGRPKVKKEIRDLMRRMSQENLTWRVLRIQSELHLLGYDVAESTISKYMVRRRNPPSQTWRTFVKNHIKQIAAMDFLTVPTVTFRALYCLIVLRHDRRSIVHFNIIANPTAEWTEQQIPEAFPYDEVPKYLIRDRDGAYGKDFCRRVKAMSIKEVMIAPQLPRQNPFAERVIGSIRRECLDHTIIFNEIHLYQVLASYFEYYNNCRTHLSLDRNSPIPRDIEPQTKGKVVAIPKVGGLHHRYVRVA